MRVTWMLYVVAAVWLSEWAGQAEPVPVHTEDVNAAVTWLLEHVAAAECTFVRNGAEHGGVEAAAHMRRKYEHFMKDIRTPEDFIRLVATKSLLSGRPYMVRLPDGTELACAEWMTMALKRYRENRAPDAVVGRGENERRVGP